MNFLNFSLLSSRSCRLPARAAGALLTLAAFSPSAIAQTASHTDSWPNFSGTLRGKWEWQTGEGQTRFEVRTARFAFDGKVTPEVDYKAEVDLSDEGRIKMLDAYAGVRPLEGLRLRLGQMRVPFSIDAPRSPHKQYFANRSFIAKQVGNVRDVGLCAGWQPASGSPLLLEAGLFNGSGLTDQKDYWTRSLNFSAKATLALGGGLSAQASVQKISPAGGNTYLYDGGLTWQWGRWTVEAEYLRKHYTSPAFQDVNALDAFVCYDLPLRGAFRKVSLLCRYDCMGDHSDGSIDEAGRLRLTDAARQRLTGGLTWSLAKKMNADIRMNFEKYFYENAALAKPSERDKVVVELVVHFPNQ